MVSGTRGAPGAYLSAGDLFPVSCRLPWVSVEDRGDGNIRINMYMLFSQLLIFSLINECVIPGAATIFKYYTKYMGKIFVSTK